MKTARQIVVKVLLRQSEFGIMAGRPSRSWRPTHRMNTGIKANEMLRRAMLEGSLISEVLPVIVLECAVSKLCHSRSERPHTQIHMRALQVTSSL